MDCASSPPTYRIPQREVVAVEHPMIIKNIDNGLKTFGKGKPFVRILDVDDQEGCLPLYLRPSDPMAAPILSHNSATSNVLLKITVPKRVRKRKRGSQDPYTDIVQSSMPTAVNGSTEISLSSHSRNDDPAQLLRSLRDNAKRYDVEAVAEINRTHRYRGLTDFHHSTAHSEFSTKFQEFILPGDVEKMRQFKFNPSRGWKENEQFMPPPVLTPETVPFNWQYQQNHYVVMSVDEVTGENVLRTKSKSQTTPLLFLTADAKSVPQNSTFPLPVHDGERAVLQKVAEAMEERPVWTRRALGNRIGHEELPVPISRALHHIAYQFKGGPFRDAIIKYGVDPRTDPKYCKYQTVFFQIYEGERGSKKEWKDINLAIPLSSNVVRTDTTTHMFDGKTFALDGKVWQLCDITDPLLRNIIDNAPLRSKYDTERDGWYSNGTWAKVQAIMRTMLIAIRARVPTETLDFKAALDFPDVVENNERGSKRISVPVPDIRLSAEKMKELVEDGVDISFLQPSGATKPNKKKRIFRIAKPGLRRKQYDVDSGKTESGEETSKDTKKRTNKEQVVSNRDSGVEGYERNQIPPTNTPSDAPVAADEDDIRNGGDRDNDGEDNEDDLEEQETDDDMDKEEDGDNDPGRDDLDTGEYEEEFDGDTVAVNMDPANFSEPRSST